MPLTSTPLFGREPELAAIERAFGARAVRLLTLTGPPGVGKTRLALASADRLSARFADGVVFVDLARVRHPDTVSAQVAAALGVDAPSDGPLPGRLSSWLADKELLLVIDNFEHVLAAAPEVTALLAPSHRVHVLVTSRERLHVAAEHELAVPPLPMPQRADLVDLSRLARNPSMALLIERARRLLPELTITPDNAESLLEICVGLEGIPLALELAAARLKVFSPAQLVDRLRDHLSLLTGGASDVPPRHRTLRAAVEWSHNLLPLAERVVFRRCSVFVGGWTMEAAEQVCQEAGVDVVSATSSLLDKSLVRRRSHADGAVEFSMTEGLREFAAEQLEAFGELARTRAAHATYFAFHAGRAEAGVGTADETRCYDWLGHTQGNLLAALDHCLRHQRLEPALRLAGALGWYWYMRGRIGDGAAALAEILSAAEAAAEPAPRDAHAGALMAAGILAWNSGELAGAERLLRRCIDMAGPDRDRRRRAIAEAFLGHVARARGEYDAAAAHHRRAGDLFEHARNRRGLAWSRYDLGLLARDRGRLAESKSLIAEALRAFHELDYPWAVASSAWGLGTVLLRQGELDEAARLLVQALDLYLESDDPRGIAQCFEALGGVAFRRSGYVTSTRLLAAAELVRSRVAAAPTAADAAAVQAIDDELVRLLDARTYDAARLSGRTMPRAAAVEVARSMVDEHGHSTPALTRRERQVAGLVAAGRTNRQVARTLGITEKTAETHVYHVMGKLGAHNRAEIASWATAEGLLPARAHR